MKFRILVFLTLFVTQAMAVCYHNGKAYNTGDIVGDYVCSASGQWLKK